MNEIPNRVCIIGAGSSGIAACKVLQEHGIPYDCYEASDRIGGNWAFGNPNNMSSAYKSLFINTSRPRMQYSDYPMPDSYPVFPHHTQIAAYFNSYVDHFAVRKHIHFNTVVSDAAPLEGGGWEVTLGDGSVLCYRALLVASGHHWNPRWPDPPFPGHFSGDILHSHYYREPDPYVGKRVLVLGFGNSAMDIAVETSRVSLMTYLAVRRGFHILPKYIFGRPLDQLPVPGWVPSTVQRKAYGVILRLLTGKFSEYGLPEPDHKALDAHPTISSDILSRIAHGCVKVRPNIKELAGEDVIFVDGNREQIDCIIYCTGYKVTFPFFKSEVIKVDENDLPLYHRVFHPRYKDLFFVGLLQPLGAIMPLAEIQSIWISKYLLGEYALPLQDELERRILHEREVVRKRYGGSPRHTMQVDYEPYARGVLKEMKRRGKERSSSSPLIQRETPVVATSHY